MKKRPVPIDPKAALDSLAADLVARTAAFCDAYLSEEYGAVCAKLVAKLRRKRVVPFSTGRPEIWAASVVYALCQINFAFDRAQTPHTTADEIAAFFAVSKRHASYSSVIYAHKADEPASKWGNRVTTVGVQCARVSTFSASS